MLAPPTSNIVNIYNELVKDMLYMNPDYVHQEALSGKNGINYRGKQNVVQSVGGTTDCKLWSETPHTDLLNPNSDLKSNYCRSPITLNRVKYPLDGPVCYDGTDWKSCDTPLETTEFDSLQPETANVKWYLHNNTPVLDGAK